MDQLNLELGIAILFVTPSCHLTSFLCFCNPHIKEFRRILPKANHKKESIAYDEYGESF